MWESRRWLGCHGGPERSTKSDVEAPATRKHYGSDSSAYVTFQQTHMRSTILVRSTIHAREVLVSVDQYMDMHEHFHNRGGQCVVSAGSHRSVEGGCTAAFNLQWLHALSAIHWLNVVLVLILVIRSDTLRPDRFGIRVRL